MKIWRLVIKEILYRKLSFALGLVSVAVAVGCLIGSLTLLRAYNLRTQQIVERKQAQTKKQMDKLKDDMRKATLKLGLNLAILPRGQNLGDWYADDYGSKYMDEKYVDKLANSGVVTVRHLLPNLQQKIKWPEKKRTIILVGTRGEVPNLHKSPRKPLVQPVPMGKMVVGYELHQSLGLKVGDKVKLLGREFVVHRCHEERGSKDDITVWIYLKEAQELLDKKGLINAIIALHCLCAGPDLSKMRSDIMAVLPDTQVVEIGTEKALARVEARMKAAETAKAEVEGVKKLRLHLRDERERFASILVVIIMVASGIWIGFLAMSNVRERRPEIGILRTLGFRSGQILFLFLSKAIVMGFAGGLLGFITGLFVGRGLGGALEQVSVETATAQMLFDPALLILSLVLAPLLSGVASWIPSMIAAQQDPAEILQKE
jgi:hypothetical protein